MKQLTMLIAMLFILPAGSWGADNDPLFEEIDADKSGTISIDEFINAPLGMVKTAEGKRALKKLFPAGNDKAGANCIPLTAGEKRAIFNSLDRDKNKAVDRKEWVIFKDGKFLF